jgi:PAS domain S-box-containing protein
MRNIVSLTNKDNGRLILRTIDDFPIGICVTDHTGKFIMFNKPYLDLYGYKQEDLLGKNFTVVVPEPHKEKLQKLHDAFIEQAFELLDVWEVQRADGQKIHVMANASLITVADKPNKVTFVVNVSDLKQVEEQLQNIISSLQSDIQQQEKSLHMAFHEMRQPAGNIISISDYLISHRDMPEEEQLEWLKMIKTSGYKTLQFIDLMVGLNHLENQRNILKLENIKSLSFFNSLLKPFKLLADKTNLKLEFNIDGEPAKSNRRDVNLYGDPLYLEHMLTNVLKNAMEAAPSGSTVTVDVDSKNPCRISIHNQGEVPKEVKDRFFDKYATHGKKQGSGLGTHIAKLITEAHGGSINFNSTKENGTTIYIELPQNGEVEEAV